MLSWIGNLETTATEFVFLDRDGVINYDSPEYIKSPDEVIFIPGSLEALALLVGVGRIVGIGADLERLLGGFRRAPSH